MYISPLLQNVNFKRSSNIPKDIKPQENNSQSSISSLSSDCKRYISAVALASLMILQQGCEQPLNQDNIDDMNQMIHKRYTANSNKKYDFSSIKNDNIRNYLSELQNKIDSHIETISLMGFSTDETPRRIYYEIKRGTSDKQVMNLFEVFQNCGYLNENTKQGYKKFKQIYNAYTNIARNEIILDTIKHNEDLFNTNITKFLDSNANPKEVIDNFVNNIGVMENLKKNSTKVELKYISILNAGMPHDACRCKRSAIHLQTLTLLQIEIAKLQRTIESVHNIDIKKINLLNKNNTMQSYAADIKQLDALLNQYYFHYCRALHLPNDSKYGEYFRY